MLLLTGCIAVSQKVNNATKEVGKKTEIGFECKWSIDLGFI